MKLKSAYKERINFLEKQLKRNKNIITCEWCTENEIKQARINILTYEYGIKVLKESINKLKKEK